MKTSSNARRPMPGRQFTVLPTSYPTRHRQIEQLAYNLYLQRGKKPGHDLEDWLEAEKRLDSLIAEENFGDSE